MNRSLTDGHFNDYNIVYLPYCTGDLFVGDKYLEASESVYSQALGNKQCLGQDKGMYMNGYNNTMAVLKWALQNYPEPEHLVLGGYSAGSLAAQMWSAFVAKEWGVESKSTKFQVLADSYVGVFPEYKVAAGSLINYYGGCGLVGFPDAMVAQCEAETATAAEMVSSLMEQAPSGEWLFVDSIADKTQRKFYQLVLLGIAGYPFTTLLPADEFYGNMTVILDTYSAFMNVTRFNIDSEQHVWLTGNDYASAVDLEGEMLGDVLTSWLSDSASTPTSTTATPTSTPEATTSAPTTTPESTTATPISTPEATKSPPIATPAATTSSSTLAPNGTTDSPTSIPEATTATPVSTADASSSTTTPEPTIGIFTYC
ncbi:hypothetical protein PHYBOEH_008044 [Phytophthora boehmeriae]|uniref:Carbohydrate esterase n=1 Tax=Phytophthora boehmeriae TaxID=109152 RepID=A0A8T1X8A5_9STRA|nr:hypothetical protein PHYBOEH_008044 [Phytophthora boehmeriae]